ncbi:hypothetical protein H5410_027759 [Solanum commersonii]|uniref:Uncharacterized protein n=1 Tax=Solanum commersonii TaxID=4109 RepID=A0A9J5Z025_SOLCO|nr:hypothetical protein H5410_027759 [Solanum commersonii]
MELIADLKNSSNEDSLDYDLKNFSDEELEGYSLIRATAYPNFDFSFLFKRLPSIEHCFGSKSDKLKAFNNGMGFVQEQNDDCEKIVKTTLNLLPTTTKDSSST